MERAFEDVQTDTALCRESVGAPRGIHSYINPELI